MTYRVCQGIRIPSETLSYAYGDEKYTLDGDDTKGYLIPSDFPIGKYKGSGATVNGKKYRYIIYYVLFSPNSCGELVDTRYLTNNVGYTGAKKSGGSYTLRSNGWKHSLKVKSVVDNVFRLVGKVLDKQERSDAALAARILCTHGCNGNYSSYLLKGVWGESAEDITFARTFSSVMSNYFRRSTSYAQCFIYSAALCALMRHIGIQCRQMCATSCGHDGNRNSYIERINEGGRGDSEKLWNFHALCENYLKQPNGKGNWCSIDMTPQETSITRGQYGHPRNAGYRKFVCGPCSIPGLRTHDTKQRYSYDLPYITAATQGFIAYGVEKERRGGRPLHIFYATVPDVTNRFITVEQADGRWIDMRKRYRPKKPYDPDEPEYILKTNREGNRVSWNVSGDDIPDDLKAYAVVIRSNKSRSLHPNPNDGEPFKIYNLTGSVFTIPKNYSHCYIITGVTNGYSSYPSYLVARISRKIPLSSDEFPTDRVSTRSSPRTSSFGFFGFF